MCFRCGGLSILGPGLMRTSLFLLLTGFILYADHTQRQQEVLLSMAGNWSGTADELAINSDNKEFPSKTEQKSQGKLVFNNQALFRRVHLKRIIPKRDNKLYDSFVITFWLDFKQMYRSITFDAKGRVYFKDFTVKKDGSCEVYAKIDNKFIFVGKSKITKDKFHGKSEYEYRGYIRKAKWEFDKVKEVKFEDPKFEIDVEIKKVLDTLPGKYPLPGHFKLHEEKNVLKVFGYDTKQQSFMKWEIHSDGNYRVFEGKGFLKEEKGYWKQVE